MALVVHTTSTALVVLVLVVLVVPTTSKKFDGRPLPDDCCQLLPVEPTFAQQPLITMRFVRDKSTVETQIQMTNSEIQSTNTEIQLRNGTEPRLT